MGKPNSIKGRHLLIVGVSKYQHHPDMALPGVAKDADRFEDVMTNPHYLGNIELRNRAVLRDGEATRESILLSILDISEKAGYQDQVIIYFAGHASFHHGTGVVYFLPFNATPEEAATKGISMGDLANLIDAISSKEVILIFDCCYAGAFGEAFGDKLKASFRSRKNCLCILACYTPQEIRDFDEGGLLVTHLVEALEGKQRGLRSGEGWISIQAAFQHADSMIDKVLPAARLYQKPIMFGVSSTIYVSCPPKSHRRVAPQKPSPQKPSTPPSPPDVPNEPVIKRTEWMRGGLKTIAKAFILRKRMFALIGLTAPTIIILLIILIILWPSKPIVDLASRNPGDTFQPVINLPWFHYAHDFGRVSGSSWAWDGVSQRRAVIDETFRNLAGKGIRGVVWFLFGDGRASPEFDAKGYVTGLDQEFWQDYDAAIEVARKYDMGILWVLVDYHWMLPGQVQNGAPIFGHADIIEDAAKRESFFKNALTPLLKRHPSEPHIVGWVLLNEPENALKDGHVSTASVYEFISKAAAQIKDQTKHQPVSVANVDLEALLEFQSKTSADLDFFIFHHYEQFLPPPVDIFRALLSKAGDKPVYIGEFSFEKPPILDEERLVRWAHMLGYAGLWPWSLQEKEDAPPAYNKVEAFSKSVERANPELNANRTLFTRLWHMIRPAGTQDARVRAFDERRRSPAIDSDLRNDIQWWIDHGRTEVMPAVESRIKTWQPDLPGHNQGVVDNKAWEGSTLGWIARIKLDVASAEKELERARSQYTVNEAWLNTSKTKLNALAKQLNGYNDELARARRQLQTTDTQETREWIARTEGFIKTTQLAQAEETRNRENAQNGIADAAKWAGEAEAHLTESKDRLKEQEGYLNEARRKQASHGYLLEVKGDYIKLVRDLYLRFWEEEIKWARANGIVDAGSGESATVAVLQTDRSEATGNTLRQPAPRIEMARLKDIDLRSCQIQSQCDVDLSGAPLDLNLELQTPGYAVVTVRAPSGNWHRQGEIHNGATNKILLHLGGHGSFIVVVITSRQPMNDTAANPSDLAGVEQLRAYINVPP